MPSNKQKKLSGLPENSADKEYDLAKYDQIVSMRVPKDILKEVDVLVRQGKQAGKRANRTSIIMALLRDALRLDKESK